VVQNAGLGIRRHQVQLPAVRRIQGQTSHLPSFRESMNGYRPLDLPAAAGVDEDPRL
jgi:hypothetical protein